MNADDLPDLPPLDVASALTLLGDAVSGLVLRNLDGTGLRHGHGYVVQRLLLGPTTATEIAQELGVTQQAVSKTLKELIALGHVETAADTADRRRRPVQLTARGHAAVETARAARRQVDDRIRSAIGPVRFSEMISDLTKALDALDLTENVRRRAVPPPTPDFS